MADTNTEYSVVLDKESKGFIDFVNGTTGPIDLTLPVDKVRDIIETSASTFRGDFIYNGDKEDIQVPCVSGQDVPVTILRPSSDSNKWNNVMVYFHGGGWVWGSRQTHMAVCEMISQTCSCVVVNVEYRLAPENKFPACYEDAENVVRWCLDNKVKLAGNDKALLGVAGDSAGGNIAASVCHLVNSIDYQVLIYSCLTISPDSKYPSTDKFEEKYLLTNSMFAWFLNHFVNSLDDISTELASPIKRSSLAGLPPALFVVAECDPIADHSEDYRQRLAKANVKTELAILKGVIHGFVEKPGWFKETNLKMIEIIKNFMANL